MPTKTCVKRMIKAMKKQPTQTLLMSIIILVFILAIVQVLRRDPQVEKLDWLKNLFGLGEETNSSSSTGNGSSSTGNGSSSSTGNSSSNSTVSDSTGNQVYAKVSAPGLTRIDPSHNQNIDLPDYPDGFVGNLDACKDMCNSLDACKGFNIMEQRDGVIVEEDDMCFFKNNTVDNREHSSRWELYYKL